MYKLVDLNYTSMILYIHGLIYKIYICFYSIDMYVPFFLYRVDFLHPVRVIDGLYLSLWKPFSVDMKRVQQISII